MADSIDRLVAKFNDYVWPSHAPGCETCGGSIRAVRECLDGPPVAVIDIAHSDAGCPTLARASGIRRFPEIDRVFVRHRLGGAAQGRFAETAASAR